MTVPLRGASAKAEGPCPAGQGPQEAGQRPRVITPVRPAFPGADRFRPAGGGSSRTPTAPAEAAGTPGVDQTASRSTTKMRVSPGLIAGVGLWLP